MLSLCAPLVPILAQKGLNVSPVFEGTVIPEKRMVKTLVRGSQAKSYKLSLFHSLKMEASAEECDQIETLLKKDCHGLESESVQEYGMRDGRLSYLIAQLPDRDNLHIFLCYQCYEEPEGNFHLTLVYMEGAATIMDLYKIFKTDKNKKK